MFERYTDSARRAIFFALFEANHLGCRFIETEHLLLAVFRQDGTLARRLLPTPGLEESIRKQIEDGSPIDENLTTQRDKTVSEECKRVFAYTTEEAERLLDPHIDTGHIVLGFLREEQCLAAKLLNQRGVLLSDVRDKLRH